MNKYKNNFDLENPVILASNFNCNFLDTDLYPSM